MQCSADPPHGERSSQLRVAAEDVTLPLEIACHVQGAWEAAENILNTIVLPPAIDDAGGAGSKNYDYTQVSLLLPATPSLILYCTLMCRGASRASWNLQCSTQDIGFMPQL